MSSIDSNDAERVNREELDEVPPGSADEVGETEEAGEWTPGGGKLGAEGEAEGEKGLAGAGPEDTADEEAR